MRGQWWGGGPEPWPRWPVGQHWPGSCWGLPAQRHSTTAYGTILQLLFIRGLAQAQWSFYNWGFSKKLYYSNQLASSSSSSSSSSFLKTVITSRSVFGLLWSFSFPRGLWAQLQVVALQGTLERNLPPELAGGTLQGWSCRGRPSTDALLWVSRSSGLGRGYCLCLLFPVQWLYLGTNRRLPVDVIPEVCAQRPFPRRSCSVLASKSMLHLASASQLCIPSDQCCIRRKRGIWGAPPSLLFAFSLTWALCEISLRPPAEWSQPLLDNVRTCLIDPQKTGLKNSYKQNKSWELPLRNLIFLVASKSYIHHGGSWTLSFWISEMKKKKWISQNLAMKSQWGFRVSIRNGDKITWIHTYDHRWPWWFW